MLSGKTVFLPRPHASLGCEETSCPSFLAAPNLDQLRRQARELLRAVADGELSALTWIRAFSERVSLSTAQLAVAREYGFASWPALHAEVERRLAGWPVLSVAAGDDLGGMCLSQFDGSRGRGDHEELTLRFLPRLNPLARALMLTFSRRLNR